MQNVTLDTIGSGALKELFETELARILTNIADPNTDTTAKRTMSIVIKFKTNQERDVADVAIACSSKLAGFKTVSSQLFIGRKGGKLVAVENDPRQSGLFDEDKPTLAAVAQFPQQPKDGE